MGLTTGSAPGHGNPGTSADDCRTRPHPAAVASFGCTSGERFGRPAASPARLRVQAGPGACRRILRSNGDCKHLNAGAIHACARRLCPARPRPHTARRHQEAHHDHHAGTGHGVRLHNPVVSATVNQAAGRRVTLVRHQRRSPDVTLLAHKLNRSVDPCHDFDAYVCSTWKPDDRFPRVSQTLLGDLSISWLDGLPELLEEGAKVASLAAKPLAMYSSCVENSGSSEADKGLFLEFLRDRKLAWPDKPRGGVRAPTVFVDLAMNWEMALWMRVRVLKHPFTPGARRFLLLPGRRSDVRLFAALHEYVMSTGDYARYWGLIYHFFMGQQPGPEYEMVIKESAESQGDVVAILIPMAMLRSYTNASLIR
ncbi:uncharacterized protein LOC142775438 [Rhipicephalus microplus]|uniref:uncharacterized protein LOC142775438 n=1 Tax=Rhipicephalus microplus TaxID=6941 RepID=UPI003F6ABFE5